jgi:hypothetical protein
MKWDPGTRDRTRVGPLDPGAREIHQTQGCQKLMLILSLSAARNSILSYKYTDQQSS